ncbi:MAG TPA: phenylalanine--tRNA ligase subunit alpha, partial [Candidatus Limnocylindria bacterium]|nr:phenylalanine--tRNA ligase subunit alpha [Candidatus Limnocylindria bacterium]
MPDHDLRALLERLRQTARARLAEAHDAASVDELRSGLLGRSGELTILLKQLRDLPGDQRPAVGQLANQVRAEIEAA